ncbi:MAG: L-histidine N(alpha)-methyltransferase [Acidiphilium sp. 37-64-53]|uniref:L-histidine N(alpha)-methyltransferase n=1 Tax=Acidiphilium TaxID=522 RepID=UPI000BCD3606|nr:MULTISPECIES: L-histidine N(alpha)-methyltransferase [Acidiphilium]OYV99547.1 MAG: L-histidine N(alpha)-methyltransferase [Acidiphilium sp. 37-64-53]HQT86903.1 L-histidine N(alpha)-methyltransferase [Acidiphilium rubrum]
MPEGFITRVSTGNDVAAEALRGLSARRKTLPPKLFYDEAGCALFGAITNLPEYYATRTETGILRDRAAEIAARIAPGCALVEYGASDESKAAILFDHLDADAYVPIDIAHDALQNLTQRMGWSHRGLTVHPIAADFLAPVHLPNAICAMPKLGFFPGSTIGNLDPAQAVRFLGMVRETLDKGASLLIGVDLEKSPALLVPAYDDAEGVTAAFNLNILQRLNREADADFDPGLFKHRAIWNDHHKRIEMHLQSRIAQTIYLAGHPIRFHAGETIHTENSYKFSISAFSALAQEAGWQSDACWTDADELFSVHLLGT